MRRSYSMVGPQQPQQTCFRQGSFAIPQQQPQHPAPPPAFQGPQYPHQQQQSVNWTATAEFVSRAKQAALQQSGNTHLAALFGSCGPNQSQGAVLPPPPPPSQQGGGGAFMRPGRIAPQQNGGGQGGCQCPNCAPQTGMPFGVGPMDAQQGQGQPQQPIGGGVVTFTTQLAGIPVPEHPSGPFPTFDFVMVPPGPGQQSGGCNCPNCSGGANAFAEGNQFQPPQAAQMMPMQSGGWGGPSQPQKTQPPQQQQQQQPHQNAGGCCGSGSMCGSGLMSLF